MNTQEIKTAIRKWIYSILAIDTVYASPNSPRPETEYVVFNIVSDQQIGKAEKQTDTGPAPDVTISYSTLNSILVSINTYYDNAYDNAKILKRSLEKTDINASLYEDGLGLQSVTDINRIPEEVDSQWEERAQFDVNFLYRDIDTEEMQQIEHIEITNEINGEEITIDKP